MPAKRKAALQGRLNHFSNFTKNHITLINQVNVCKSAHIFSNYGKSPQHLTEGGISPSVTAAMARFPTVLQICNSLLAGGIRHWRTPLSHKFSGDPQSAENSADIRFAEKPADQPFGSMPRACSSLRIIRFNQAETVSSPSSFIALCIDSSREGSTRNAICLLPLGILMFDMCLTLGVVCIVSCNVHHMSDTCKATKPGSASTLTGPLTKPLFEVTVMAGSQHTQTHPKFTWRFLALSASTRNVIHITAATEREARDQSPAGCVMVFAGRLPVQEVSHA
jgi:hypothetical protein